MCYSWQNPVAASVERGLRSQVLPLVPAPTGRVPEEEEPGLGRGVGQGGHEITGTHLCAYVPTVAVIMHCHVKRKDERHGSM